MLAYMYTANSSPACTGETGREMNTPPEVGAEPAGAFSPLPIVAERSVASHQLGWACRLTCPTETVSATTSESPLACRLIEMDVVRKSMLNHSEGREKTLQWST